MTQQAAKARILTGDTPTGRLHLGHFVGSLENRLALQDEYDCYFLIANSAIGAGYRDGLAGGGD